MPMFQLKPVEAIQVVDFATAAAWCGGTVRHVLEMPRPNEPLHVREMIPVGVCPPGMPSDDIAYARPLDWIIRQGDRFVVMRNGAFQAVYEPSP